ncbi:MAG TPA: TonB-dependent receptor [Blastocatellia bacterium]|nr:TonB-dependent receptor [Blastocatellia bacterium]
MKTRFCLALLMLIVSFSAVAQSPRTLSGTIVTRDNEAVPGVTVSVRSALNEQQTVTDAAGRFTLQVPDGALTVQLTGKNIAPQKRALRADQATDNLRFEISWLIPPIHDSLVISASQPDPSIDRRNDTIYRNTLFSRDDQIFQTLDAGINAGQHEGGGKSVEIRRFGFNLDHGGVGGGLKVLVDNVQQNQSTQGHGQGYLGQLKSLTPELVQDVDILNGPFRAEYGDFSGLGVVHIRLKESLPDQFTARFQGGSFDSFRTFLAYSPQLRRGEALVAYEGSRTDGPFINPLDYKRDNLTGNYIHRLSNARRLGFKFNFGRNDFTSSGQLPLDQVAAGRLDRFGFLDPDNGGRVRSGVASVYFKQDAVSGGVFKLDGFVARSLFDLYSNFTFFLNDETNGDEIQQHDSRLQQGANAQYLRPYQLFGQSALLTLGANFHDNQINVGLNRSLSRAPVEIVTKAQARVTNASGYAQQAVDLFHGHLQIEGGLRYDVFRFRVDDRTGQAASGTQTAARVQPKFNLSLTPADRLPMTLYFNYGRGISSQDARGVVQQPDGPKVSTTDFYQLGASHRLGRLALSYDLFLIDRSNEQVYIPDDGSFEFRGPSRADGFEIKAAVKLSSHLSFNGGVTKVMNAFYRGTAPRVYIDSAPHVTGNAALTLTAWKGLNSSLRYRHTSSYRLDGEDALIRASGLDVLDLSLSKELRRRIELNLSIDNLTDKRYYETQNYFESRIRPGDPVIARIHGTPGYPRTVTAGLTFRLGGK